jgi:hypothetical protein
VSLTIYVQIVTGIIIHIRQQKHTVFIGPQIIHIHVHSYMYHKSSIYMYTLTCITNQHPQGHIIQKKHENNTFNLQHAMLINTGSYKYKDRDNL